MYGLVSALENGVRRDFIFRTKKEAGMFVEFMRLYVQEVAPGNGYGAYWPRGQALGVDGKRGCYSLNLQMIERMAAGICDARQAVRGSGTGAVFYMPSCGIEDAAITFNFDKAKLPPRIAPQAGDTARIVDEERYDRVSGRVLHVAGNQVTLDCVESRMGVITLLLANVMKVAD